MNLHTKFSIGDKVYLTYDIAKREMFIVGIEIFGDGGYTYKCNMMDSDGAPRSSYFFEMELESFE